MSPRPRYPTRTKSQSSSEIRPDQIYHPVRFRQSIIDPVTGATIVAPYPIKVIDATGDHLTVIGIRGSYPIYVKFGNFRNPWVRIQARTVYKRSFRKLWFVCGDNITAPLGGQVLKQSFVEAICYASIGPLVEFSPKVPGIGKGFMALQIPVAASPTETAIIDAVTSQPTIRSMTAGMEGGWMMLRNSGAFPIDIRYGTFGAGSTGWVMAVSPDPSSVLSVPLVDDLREWTQPGSLFLSDIIARGVGGASTLNILISPWEHDGTIPEVTPNLSIGG